MERKRNHCFQSWHACFDLYDKNLIDRNEILDRLPTKDHKLFLEFLLEYAKTLDSDARQQISPIMQEYLGRIQMNQQTMDRKLKGHLIEIFQIFSFPQFETLLFDTIDDPSPYVVLQSAYSLVSNNYRPFLELVINNLHRLQSVSVNYLSVLLAQEGNESIPYLLQIYGDTKRTSKQRIVAAAALRKLESTQAVPYAVKILIAEEETELLAESIRVIRDLGGEEHTQTMSPFVDSSHEILRIEAMEALATIGGEKDAEIFLSCLNDPNLWVVYHAMAALQRIGRTDVLDQYRHLRDPRGALAAEMRQYVSK